ncbi:MAG: cupin domain-containing protein [Proteobacteria bacterium]|nr:cupin domain-containing protein [Pseudomonadota bacterium]
MTLVEIKNIFTNIPDCTSKEVFETLLDNGNFKIERIVSMGQTTPAGEWYDQERDEWVIVLTGSTGLSFKGDREIRVMKPGDHLFIPAHTIHRVEWTTSHEKTIWLAIHFPAGQKL